jgi:Protein of unknown function (DUF3500)
MTKTMLLVPVLGVALWCGYFGLAWNAREDGTKATAYAQTEAVVTATTAFLNSLSTDQKNKVLFPFTPVKTASTARFSRSGMGGGPQGGHGGPGGSGDHPRPGGGPGMGPAGGFVGERYGEAVWSNYPVSDVPRPGLRLGSLNAVQRRAAMDMLQVLLSPKGYEKVLEIMGSDQALSESGTPFASGAAVYTIGIFGSPIGWTILCWVQARQG